MIPRGLWEDVSMDFITKLPKSKDPVTGITYNLIIVIVDRFTKYLIAVLFKETHTAEQLGHLLLDRLVRCYDPGDGSHLFIGNQATGQARGHHGSQVTNQQEVT